MSSSKDDIVAVSTLIRKDFNFDSSDLTNHNIMGELHQQLTQIIRYLLDKDFSRLLNAMYRIDIQEEKLKKALSIDPPDEVAPTIATLIIEREMQKVVTRKRYQ